MARSMSVHRCPRKTDLFPHSGVAVDDASRRSVDERQREVVEAFFRAARGGDFDRLVAVLDPDVVLREDLSAKRPVRVFRGAAAVASQARSAAFPGAEVRWALVNGAAGAVVVLRGKPFAILGFTVRGDKIVEIDGIAGADRVRRVASAVLD
jgi:hypothetical protein